MILVRDVSQLKVGKANDAKARWKEAAELAQTYDMPVGRALTDLTGRKLVGTHRRRTTMGAKGCHPHDTCLADSGSLAIPP